MTAFAVELAGENTHLGVAGGSCVEFRNFFVEDFCDAFAVLRNGAAVAGGEGRNFLFVRNLGEACKERTFGDCFPEQGVGIAGKEGRDEFAGGEFVGEEEFQQRGSNGFAERVGVGEKFAPEHNAVDVRGPEVAAFALFGKGRVFHLGDADAGEEFCAGFTVGDACCFDFGEERDDCGRGDGTRTEKFQRARGCKAFLYHEPDGRYPFGVPCERGGIGFFAVPDRRKRGGIERFVLCPCVAFGEVVAGVQQVGKNLGVGRDCAAVVGGDFCFGFFVGGGEYFCNRAFSGDFAECGVEPVRVAREYFRGEGGKDAGTVIGKFLHAGDQPGDFGFFVPEGVGERSGVCGEVAGKQAAGLDHAGDAGLFAGNGYSGKFGEPPHGGEQFFDCYAVVFDQFEDFVAVLREDESRYAAGPRVPGEGAAGRHERGEQGFDVMEGGDCVFVLVRGDLFCGRDDDPRDSASRSCGAVFEFVAVLFANAEEVIRGEGAVTDGGGEFAAVAVKFSAE